MHAALRAEVALARRAQRTQFACNTDAARRGSRRRRVFLLIAVILGQADLLAPRLLAAVLGSGVLVALVGYLDDRAALPARWRFLAHGIASIWSLWLMNGIPPVPVLGHDINLGWFGLALAAVYLVGW